MLRKKSRKKKVTTITAMNSIAACPSFFFNCLSIYYLLSPLLQVNRLEMGSVRRMARLPWQKNLPGRHLSVSDDVRDRAANGRKHQFREASDRPGRQEIGGEKGH